MEKLEKLLEWGGWKKDAALLAVSGAALALISDPIIAFLQAMLERGL